MSKNTYLNWEVEFKRMYPYPGPIWIDTDSDFIKCYVNNFIKGTCYLPFEYKIRSKTFSIIVNRMY